jgi:hypothetical protein
MIARPSPRLLWGALIFFLFSPALFLSSHLDALIWKYERMMTYARGLIVPVKPLPTPRIGAESPSAPSSPTPTPLPALGSFAATSGATFTPTPTFAPLPPQAFLPSPRWEKQDINNCGPATLAMGLRMYGWDGDHFDISQVIKPERPDRNVNPEEMVYYVNNYAGWLRAIFRVNGDLPLLKRLLAAGFPVIIEEVFMFEEDFWPNDDHWAAHYLLLTGYDDMSSTFIAQDSYHGADQKIPYPTLETNWLPFNRLYLLV